MVVFVNSHLSVVRGQTDRRPQWCTLFGDRFSIPSGKRTVEDTWSDPRSIGLSEDRTNERDGEMVIGLSVRENVFNNRSLSRLLGPVTVVFIFLPSTSTNLFKTFTTYEIGRDPLSVTCNRKIYETLRDVLYWSDRNKLGNKGRDETSSMEKAPMDVCRGSCKKFLYKQPCRF